MPMLGDSTMLADDGNERMLVIAPDLKIVRALRLDIAGVPFLRDARELRSL